MKAGTMSNWQKARHDPEAIDQGMARLAAERHEKYQTRVVEKFPDVRTISDPFYYGTHCWTFPGLKQRWIPEARVIDIGNGPQTRPEVARDYLAVKYPARRRAVKEQIDAIRDKPPMPLLCLPARWHAGAYVDLHAAYWSIMRLTGWDVDYWPGRWLRPGTPPTDFPLPGDKVSRNALVTCALPGPITMWTGEKFIRVKAGNPHVNLCLWHLIADVLHLVAGYALDAGAVYVHTDGAILPARNVESYQHAVAGIGLEATVKASGLTLVYGLQNWRCGGRSTRLYTPTGGSRHIINLIREVDRPWLENKLSWLMRIGLDAPHI